MEMQLFIRGLILGFSIAAPVGPIGILCIRRTLAYGSRSGFASGLGAASADALYGTLAALGLKLITDLLVSNKNLLSLAGGLFLCYLGIRTFFEKPATLADQRVLESATSLPVKAISALLADYTSTFILTLTNPVTILAFIAIFAGLGLPSTNATYTSGLVLILGVFIGSTSWWFILSTGANALRVRFMAPAALQWVNRISGLLITGFGLAAIWL